MSDTKIPTAKELVEKVTNRLVTDLQSYLLPNELVFSIMKEFAEKHVQAALKAASEKAQIAGRWGSDKEWKSDEINTTDADGDWILLRPDKDSILTAYPLDNIK